MAIVPASYFYLVDVDTDRALAIFSAEECRTYAELHALEARIRANHDVDDLNSGLALRDSVSGPLPDEQVRHLLRQQTRRAKHL